jgi:acyl dehydratase
VTLEHLINQTRCLVGARPSDAELGAQVCDWLRVQRFAEACGDENPLYLDPRYGAGSRWGTMLAPPGFVFAIQTPESRGAAVDSRCVSFLSEVEMLWDDHFHLGDRVGSELRLSGCAVGPSWRGHSTVVVRSEATYGRNGVLCAHARSAVTVCPLEDMDAPQVTRPLHSYDDDELAALTAELEGETGRRGARPRYWDDVVAGEPLSPRARGPLTWSDLVTWIIAEGRQVKAGNLRHRDARSAGTPVEAHPATKGWPYWSLEEAREDHQTAAAVGMPAPYGRGAMAIALGMAMLTDWMGDDGFLRHLRMSLHEPFVYGDAWRFTGRVRDRFVQAHPHGHYHGVVVELEARNQVDQQAASGDALVFLPRRGEPVEVPVESASCSAEEGAQA